MAIDLGYPKAVLVLLEAGADVALVKTDGKDPMKAAKEKERAKNMFALGLLSWIYTRPTAGTEAFLTRKFGSRPDILAANLAALRAGWNYGETTEDFASSFVVAPAWNSGLAPPKENASILTLMSSSLSCLAIRIASGS